MIETRVVRIREPGDEDVLSLDAGDVREPGAGEVLVEVKAAGLNRADLLQRKGFYPAPHGVVQDIPGLEYSGVVAAVGEDVADWIVGDQVMGIVAGGAMTTHLVVPARAAMRVPAGIDVIHAAAIPEVFITAYDALLLQANLRPNQLVLIHAVASGVGLAAVQVARCTGAAVVGTTRSAEKRKRLDLEHCLVLNEAKFAAEIRALAGRNPDVILDSVGAAYLEENIKALNSGGTMVAIGLLGGATGTMPLGALLAKRGRVVGTVLRSRPAEENIALTQRFSREMLPFFATGQLRPEVDAVMPMLEIQEAHRRMARNETFGKIVMRW